MTTETTDTEADDADENSTSTVEKANEVVMGARIHVEDTSREEFIDQNVKLLRNPPTVPVWFGLVLNLTLVAVGLHVAFAYNGTLYGGLSLLGGVLALISACDIVMYVYGVLRS